MESKDRIDLIVPEKKRKELSERLKVAMRAGGFTAKALADAIGASESGVKKWRSGQSDPAFTQLAEAADCLGVSLDWLATGLGEMARSAPSNERTAVNAALLGRIVADVYKLFVEERREVGAAELGALATSIYDKVFDLEHDEVELAGEITIELNRLRRAIRSGRLSGNERS